MFCSKCGKNVAEGSRFCPACGASIFSQVLDASPDQKNVDDHELKKPSIPPLQPSPVQPPPVQSTPVQSTPVQPPTSAMPALWNPNAAVNWSLLFSPSFGTFLHMRNWKALGNHKKARTAMIWFVISLIPWFFFVILPESSSLANSMRLTPLGILFWWYLFSARPQAKLIKEQFGTTYPRKGWLLPILSVVALFFGTAILMTILSIFSGTGFSLAGMEEEIKQAETAAQDSDPSQKATMKQPSGAGSSRADDPASSDDLVVPEGADPEQWAAAGAQAKAILAEGNSAAPLKYTSIDDIEFNAKSTPDGFVFESNTEISYLGNNCDAFSKGRGNGKWFWSNDGVFIEFKNSAIIFPSQKTPFDDSRCQFVAKEN